MRQSQLPPSLLPEAAQTAARRVLDAGLARSGFATSRPRLGVILGTGMGQLVERLEGEQSLPAADIGWLPRATALGHAGRLAWGDCHGQCVVMLQGRVHAYEGQSAEMLIRGVDLLAALGVERLLITNAAGGLAPGLAVGDLVVLEDHLDLVRKVRGGGQAQPAVAYDDALSTAAVAAVGGVGLAARRGVYAYCLGPTYETRAEYRMLRRFGADVVGMSTVPEVLAARGHGMRVVAASVVTNLARPDRVATGAPTDGEDVCRAAATAADGVWAILRAMLRGA